MVAQASSFLIHPSFLNAVSQDTFGTLPLTVQYFCDLQCTMPHHWSSRASHSTIPREAEDLLRGNKYPTDVSLSTFLACLQPV